MRRFEPGDRVRIDIPDETDPDHDDWHGVRGVVVNIIEDDAGQETGDSRDSHLFAVETPDDEVIHLRWRDLRPAVEE